MDIQRWKRRLSNYLESILENLHLTCKWLATNNGKEVYQSVPDTLTSSGYELILNAQNISGNHLELGFDHSLSGIYGDQLLNPFIWNNSDRSNEYKEYKYIFQLGFLPANKN